MSSAPFSRRALEERAGDPRFLLRAREIIERGRIKLVGFERRAFCAVAWSSRGRYDVRVRSDISRSTCTCPAFGRPKKFCKHIAAAALLWLGDWCPAAIDLELTGAVEVLDLFQARELLLAAAGRHGDVRRRLVADTWTPDGARACAPPAQPNAKVIALRPAALSPSARASASPSLASRRRAKRDSIE